MTLAVLLDPEQFAKIQPFAGDGRVGQAFFKDLARAQITGEAVGMLKILFHRETREILGIHCFGDQAAEIVHIGQAIMSQPEPNNTLHYFKERAPTASTVPSALSATLLPDQSFIASPSMSWPI